MEYYYDDDQTSSPMRCQSTDEKVAKGWARSLFQARQKNRQPARAGILYQELAPGDIKTVEEYGLTGGRRV